MIPGKVVSRVKVSSAVVGCKQKIQTLSSPIIALRFSLICSLLTVRKTIQEKAEHQTKNESAFVSFPSFKSDDGPLPHILQNGFTVAFF